MTRWSEFIKCPYCKGEGRCVEDHFEFGDRYEDCYVCGGLGRVSLFSWVQYWWYEYLDEKIWKIIQAIRGEK